MGPSIEEQMSGIAEDVARRYASRCWWSDPADLRQQAWVIVLEVLREFPPLQEDGTVDRGRFGSWAYVAAMRQMSRYMWRASSPVSAGDKEVRDLAGVHHLEVSEVDGVDSTLDVEREVAERELEALVTTRISELYRGMWKSAKEDDPMIAAMQAIFVEELTPKEASKRFGVPIYSLYKATEAMRGMMCNDSKLRRLGREVRACMRSTEESRRSK